MRNIISRSATLSLTLLFGIVVVASTGYAKEDIQSISKQQEEVLPPNSQGSGTVTVNFPTDVCIRGANLRMVGPSGNIYTLLSLDPTNPIHIGLEGRSGDLFWGQATGPGLGRTGANNDTNKDVFFPAGTCKLVPTGTNVYIHTIDDVGDTGGAFDHVEIIYYTVP